MSKLTREKWINEFGSIGWDTIEVHTAECVAEAVAEVKKTHFEIDRSGDPLNEASWSFIESAKKIGIRLNGEQWNNCKQGIVYPVIKAYLDELKPKVTTRPMTEDELTGAMLDHLKKPYDKFSRPTLEAMARDLGIDTKVEA